MFADRKFIWMLEYAIGFVLMAAVLPFIVHPQQGWSEAHGWAYLLFIACSSVVLLSSASAARQRMQLAKRIAKLEQMAGDLKRGSSQASSESIPKRAAKGLFVGSVN